MKRVFSSTPHLIALIIATALLWGARKLDSLISQHQLVDFETSTSQGRMAGQHPWIALLVAFVVAVAISRLQELKWPNSLRHSIVWPLVFWLLASAPILLNGLLGQTDVRPLSLLIELVGFVSAGLVLFKGKDVARRDSPPRSAERAEAPYGV